MDRSSAVLLDVTKDRTRERIVELEVGAAVSLIGCLESGGLGGGQVAKERGTADGVRAVYR